MKIGKVVFIGNDNSIYHWYYSLIDAKIEMPPNLSVMIKNLGYNSNNSLRSKKFDSALYSNIKLLKLYKNNEEEIKNDH